MARAEVESCKHGGTPTLLTGRINADEDAKSYIDGLEFAQLITRFLTQSPDHGGLGWDAKEAKVAALRYKKWLYLKRKFYDELVPPPWDVHFFWQGHLKDSLAYLRDTSAIFGQYLHHFPFFGLQNAADRKRRREAFTNNTVCRWKELYAEIPDQREDLI
jgi:hypothetical protein